MLQQKLLLNVSLLLGGVVAALLIAELIARLLGPPYGIGDEAHRSHQCDAQVGWHGVPESSISVDWYDHPHELRWNAHGLRGESIALDKPADVFRILLLGDSMVEALEVAHDETSAHVLETTLNATAPSEVRYEVINGGIFAWGPPQALQFYRTEGYRFEPDLVLAMWYPGNDLLDVLPNHIMTAGPQGGVHCFAPYFEVCDGQFDPQAWHAAPGIPPEWQHCTPLRRIVTDSLNGIYQHSRLYQRLTAGLLQVYEKPMFEDLDPWLESAAQNVHLSKAYQLTEGVYTELAQATQAQGAPTVVVIAPINMAVDVEVNPTRRAQMIAAFPPLAEADPTLPNRTLTQRLTPHAIPVLDLHPAFVNYVKAGGGDLYWASEAIHWTVAGNRLVGETLAGWLIEQGLVPTE